MEHQEIYSNKITSGNRTYCFEIKKSDQSSLYLTISESQKSENAFETHPIRIFEEDLNDFVETLRRTVSKFKELQNPSAKGEKKYSIEHIRQIHQQAYMPWTLEDDTKLDLLFCEGKRIKELALIFERNEGAISSRIKKLELREKYNR